ncbi:phosphatidylinositol-4-phosphate 5-kinase [Fusobacterium canifelinum]|uniref:Phosphatidylinositol-4-phosphate 5-kinase n=1 Tax=Fusobacterium canifelinum TaxID=285729 RepID=A0A7T4KGL4_9FUSO|nr:toxin-antitoxin system YwqK family antitoxin [Fusobacterium canifelinum]QQB73974.1 phosphatidylinositol-4-phosphate 5-kinase [Fusobacterium canifelinum]
MKKIFIILMLMLSIFSIATAHPFKTEKELNNFFSKMDQLIKEELKKDYREEMSKRKGTADREYTFEIEDDRTVLITRNIQGIKPETEITQYFNSEGKLYMISSLTKETEKDLYALYRKYDSNGNLFIYSYAIDGKNTDRGYYSDGKLAYIQELKIIIGQNPIPNGKYIEYYKNGQVKVQGNNKEGKRDGEFKAFLRNGKSAGSVFYKDGKIIKSTLVKAMKDNASFSLVTDKSYDLNLYEIITEEFKNKLLKEYLIFKKDGLFNGEKREYYEEGEIKAITPFKNSLAEGTYISYYPNGNMEEKYTYVNGEENGEGFSYYENGKLEEKYFMKNGKLDGEAFAYYPSGKLEVKDFFKNGKKEGESIFYHENGNIKQKSTFKNGKREGDLFIYFPSGKLRQTEKFINGKAEGEVIEYYESGTIKEKAYFINDKQEKEHFFYDKKGNLIKTDVYKNGVKQ